MTTSRQWLLDLERLGIKFGLDNMMALSRRLEWPQRRFRSVHIAGTNGKGSVTALVETALGRAGYATGRYTSPHLERLEERFVIGGEEVDATALDCSLDRVRDAADDLLADGTLEGPPTFFEAATAAAFDLFAAAGVEIAVVEVGLGGRLDATNVLEPIATAITTIDLDHQAQLGDTIEAIAAEKAGILKPAVPVVIGRLGKAAGEVVSRQAVRVGARVIRAHERRSDLGDWRPALPGSHQVDNAIVALALLDVLAETGFPVGESDRRAAVEGVTWPGRLEHVEVGGTSVLLDAAHNPGGARALATYLVEREWTDAALVFAAMADKDAAGMLAALSPCVRTVVCTTAPTPRAQTAAVLGDIARSITASSAVHTIEDPVDAFRFAAGLSRRVVVAGSIFVLGPLRGILR